MEEKISRRDFLKRLGLSALAVSPIAAATSSFRTSDSVQEDKKRVLTILHTNDVHSHIDPFPEEDPRYHGLGGYARRQAYIESVRAKVGAENLLVFECGDMFQGTPYFNFYKGALEMRLMNMMHVDAVTLGNHEFDNGVDALCNCMEIAEFPFINSNYFISHPRMKELVKPYKIFERAGMRIGVFGLGIKLEGLVNRMNHQGVTSGKDLVSCAREMSTFLRNEGCQLVIALTHIGYSMTNLTDDISLAMATSDVDIILGGHSHTFLAQPDIITNMAGKQVLVNQVGFGGINVGHIEVHQEKDKVAFGRNICKVMDGVA